MSDRTETLKTLVVGLLMRMGAVGPGAQALNAREIARRLPPWGEYDKKEVNRFLHAVKDKTDELNGSVIRCHLETSRAGTPVATWYLSSPTEAAPSPPPLERSTPSDNMMLIDGTNSQVVVAAAVHHLRHKVTRHASVPRFNLVVFENDSCGASSGGMECKSVRTPPGLSVSSTMAYWLGLNKHTIDACLAKGGFVFIVTCATDGGTMRFNLQNGARNPENVHWWAGNNWTPVLRCMQEHLESLGNNVRRGASSSSAALVDYDNSSGGEEDDDDDDDSGERLRRRVLKGEPRPTAPPKTMRSDAL